MTICFMKHRFSSLYFFSLDLSEDDFSEASDEDRVITDGDSVYGSNDENSHLHEFVSTTRTFISKDGQEEWSSTPLESSNRVRAWNIIRQNRGPTRTSLKTCGISPYDSFKLFVTNEMTEMIVKHTNIEGRRQLGQSWYSVCNDELHVFLGLLLLAGAYKSKNEAIRDLWNEIDGRLIFLKSMSRNRFYNLLRCLRFDAREERVKTDKISPFRTIWNLFVTKCQANYTPSAYVTIDEQLVTFRGRCGFKVYIPSKPGKYGIKLWALCDSLNNYFINGQIYTGRGSGPREVGQADRVVLKLTNCLSGSGWHVTDDNFFTNITTTRSLLGRKLTYTGTMGKNKGKKFGIFFNNADHKIFIF